jgi:hypothetical protein
MSTPRATRFDEVLGLADPHEIAGLIDRQETRDELGEVVHHRLGLADRESADRVPVESELDRCPGRPRSEVGVGPALHDPEQRLRRGRRPGVRRLGAGGPAQGQLERALGVDPRGRVRQTLVERMDDVGAERLLDLDGDLGR